jgi:hypothetical protein
MAPGQSWAMSSAAPWHARACVRFVTRTIGAAIRRYGPRITFWRQRLAEPVQRRPASRGVKSATEPLLQRLRRRRQRGWLRFDSRMRRWGARTASASGSARANYPYPYQVSHRSIHIKSRIDLSVSRFASIYPYQVSHRSIRIKFRIDRPRKHMPIV